jgi:hypothetical protein
MLFIHLLPYFIFISGEIAAALVFSSIKKLFEENLPKSESALLSVLKGTLERLVIYVSLIHNIPTVLVMFGALKIATRFDATKNKISNDYFLVGNFLSVLIALLTYALYLKYATH